MWTTAPAVDLEAAGPNNLGGWQFAVPVTPYDERTDAWKVGPAIDLTGRAVALDGKTPHANLVMELVQPVEDPGSRGDEGSSRTSDLQPPSSNQSLRAPATTNRVLQLDGRNSYVQLPDQIFHEFTEGTVEAWVNWANTMGDQRFFNFGEFLAGHGGRVAGRCFRPHQRAVRLRERLRQGSAHSRSAGHSTR